MRKYQPAHAPPPRSRGLQQPPPPLLLQQYPHRPRHGRRHSVRTVSQGTAQGDTAVGKGPWTWPGQYLRPKWQLQRWRPRAQDSADLRSKAPEHRGEKGGGDALAAARKGGSRHLRCGTRVGASEQWSVGQGAGGLRSGSVKSICEKLRESCGAVTKPPGASRSNTSAGDTQGTNTHARGTRKEQFLKNCGKLRTSIPPPCIGARCAGRLFLACLQRNRPPEDLFGRRKPLRAPKTAENCRK